MVSHCFPRVCAQWNNIRMCMEVIFVIAAATGRTLVLPPKAPLYLLNVSKSLQCTLRAPVAPNNLTLTCFLGPRRRTRVHGTEALVIFFHLILWSFKSGLR